MWPFARRPKNGVLYKPKTVKVNGLKFDIKKINVLDHLAGLTVSISNFQTYEQKRIADKDKKEEVSEKELKHFKKHMIDVIIAGTVVPEITREKEPGKIYIGDIIQDWELATSLYSKILTYTYGKKKLNF